MSSQWLAAPAHTDRPGRTPPTVVDRLRPVLNLDFPELDRSVDLFTRDPA